MLQSRDGSVRTGQELKGSLSLVKDVANPPVPQAFLRCRCKKPPVFRLNGVGSRSSNRLRPATLGLLEILRTTRRPNMAKKAATAATITLKHLAADIAEAQELSK